MFKDLIRPNSVGDFLGALLLMALFFAGIVVFWNTAINPKEGSQEPGIKEVVKKPPECLGGFEEYQVLLKNGQSLRLADNVVSYASGGEFIGGDDITVRRNGEIACGYLYVRVSKSKTPLNEEFDSIYIAPQGLGGHLLRSRSLSVPEVAHATAVLFPLSSVPYLPNAPYKPDAQSFAITDWVKLFNAAHQIDVQMALSIDNQAGLLEEVRIAYKCWDPNTGNETKGCQLIAE